MSVYSSRPSAKKTGSRLLIYYLLNASIFEALPVFIFLLFSFKSFGLQQLLQLLPDLKVIIDNGSGTQTMLPLEPFANVTEGTSGNQTPQAAAPAGQ